MNEFNTFIMSNYTYIILVAIFGICVGLAIAYPKKIKKVLLYLVSLAESDLGSGTGTLKLSKVYNMFVEKFPIFAMLVPFATFSAWVDEALEEMKKQLESNKSFANVVVNGEVK